MKCQRKASPYTACFASRSCARFSPTTSTPASASTAMSASATYLVAATTVTAGPTSARTRSYRSRTSAGDNTDDSLSARDAAVAAVGEEEVRVARRAEVHPLDRARARAPQRALGGGPEVEPPVAREVGLEALRDLRPDLVAARPDPRSDAGSVGAADRRNARLDDPFGETAPARLQHRQLRVVDERDRQAVRRQREHRHRRDVRPEAVAGLSARPRVRAVDGGGVHLPVERQRVRVAADRGAGAAAVLLHVRLRVLRQAPEVERRVRAFADAAPARREHDLERASHVPADHRRSSFARATSRSRRLSDGSPTTSASSRSSARPSSGPGSYPSSIRSSPSTARSASRCGADRCPSSTARNRASAARSSSGCGLPCRSASLWSTRSNAVSSPYLASSFRARFASARPRSSMWWRTIVTTRTRRPFGYRSRCRTRAAISAPTSSWPGPPSRP